jgi:hypothetical protein
MLKPPILLKPENHLFSLPENHFKPPMSLDFPSIFPWFSPDLGQHLHRHQDQQRIALIPRVLRRAKTVPPRVTKASTTGREIQIFQSGRLKPPTSIGNQVTLMVISTISN